MTPQALEETRFDVRRPSRETVKELVGGPAGLGLSLYIPVTKDAQNSGQNVINLKNAIAKARELLEKADFGAEAVEERLTPLNYLADNPHTLLHAHRTLAIFIDDARQVIVNGDRPADAEVQLGERFYLKPLLPVLNEDRDFYLLALARGHTALYRAEHSSLEPVELEELPRKQEDVTWPDDTEETLQEHSGATLPAPGRPGQSVEGVTHGQGRPDDLRNRQVEEFIKAVARAVSRHLSDKDEPLVVVAGEKNAGLFMSHAQLGERAVHRVHQDSNALSEAALMEAGKAQVSSHSGAIAQAMAGRIHAAPRDKVTYDVEEAAVAAGNKRIELAFVATDARQPGICRADENLAQSVESGTAAGPEGHDLLDLIAQDTVRNGGEVRMVPQAQVPGGSTVAALLRF